MRRRALLLARRRTYLACVRRHPACARPTHLCVRASLPLRACITAWCACARGRASHPRACASPRSRRRVRGRRLQAIDDVEAWRIYYELFEGAIYLNQGRKLEASTPPAGHTL